MMLAMIVIVWLSYAKVIRHSGRVNGLPIQAIGFGLGFALLAIMIQSLSDFGQHLPANACLTAVCSGLLIAMAKMAKQSKLSRSGGSVAAVASGGRLAFAKVLRVILMIAVVGGFGWAVIGANAARCGEHYWLRAMHAEQRQDETDWLGDNDEYAELLSYAQVATEYQPVNVRYNYWLNVYRWRAISRVADPVTGELVMTDETLDFTRRIVADLHDVRKLCPTYGATYSMVGQLEYFILNEPVGIEHIRTGYQLAPCDATACFVAGLLDVMQEEYEVSIEKFERAVELDGSMFEDVVDVYINQANRPDLAVQIAGDNIGWLSRVATILSEMTGHEELAAQARRDVIVLLTEKCRQDDVSASALASLAHVYLREEDYPAAVEYFRSALVMEYGQTSWRLAMARALAQQGENEQAIHEARICLRLRPQMTAATRFIEELSVLPQ